MTWTTLKRKTPDNELNSFFFLEQPLYTMTEENKDKLTKNELLAEQLQKLLKAQSTRMELYSEFDM